MDEATGITRVAGGDVGEVKAPVEELQGRIWYDDDNDGLLTDAVDAEPGAGADTPAAGIEVTLERYYHIVDEEQKDPDAVAAGWVRDDYLNAIPGKTTWASEDQWKAYDADPTVGLGGTGDHTDGVGRTVATDENGVYHFPKLKTHGRYTDEHGVSHLVIYAYRVRITDQRWWDRYFGTAKLQVSGFNGTDYDHDSDLNVKTGYLMGDDEYDVLLQVSNGAENNANSPISNGRVAPNSKNPNNGEDEAAATSDVTSAGRMYDLAWGITRVHNDGGLRVPITQKIAGLLWRDSDDAFTAPAATTDYNGLRDEGEPGLAGKRVILKQWYWAPVDADGAEVDAADADHYEWKQNKKFGNDLYTQAEHGSDAAADEGVATDTLATIPGSHWDATEGGIWVLTSDGKTVTDNGDGTTTETVDAAKVGQYLFDKLPTRYVRAHKGNELGTEYLAGYTVEVLGNVNGASVKQPDQRAQAVTGLPAPLVQQRTASCGASRPSSPPTARLPRTARCPSPSTPWRARSCWPAWPRPTAPLPPR